MSAICACGGGCRPWSLIWLSSPSNSSKTRSILSSKDVSNMSKALCKKAVLIELNTYCISYCHVLSFLHRCHHRPTHLPSGPASYPHLPIEKSSKDLHVKFWCTATIQTRFIQRCLSDGLMTRRRLQYLDQLLQYGGSQVGI